MALHWFEASIVKRSEGQNVIARAAYNARERLEDERTKQVYDYRHLGETEWSGIFSPEHAPDWVADRERLWNAVEAKEDQSKHRDRAQLARDFKIALPAEFNAEQRLALAQEYAERMAKKGMVVDLAIHPPHAHNDDRNYHAHMLLTMREIGPEGFGYKVREWNRKTEFNQWVKLWSELGAEHLERTGFKREAERFRDGHLSRPERARRAHERGDLGYFEQLLNEPEKHRGPAASNMERKGKRTRQGDLNREIQQRNSVRGVPREIREAYFLSTSPETFAKALEEKDMMLARITERDARSSAVDFAFSDQISPQYREGEYVVATERGAVYRLTGMTTGDSFRGVAKFMKPHDQQDCPSLEAAIGEMKKRSLIPKIDRNEVIAKMMEPWKVVDVAISNLPHEVQARYQDPFDGSVPLDATIPMRAHQPKDHPREALPYGANMPHVQGPATKVWWAYNSVDSPEAFQDSLSGRGFHLARVTAEDAKDSSTDHWAAKRQGKYSPILGEGEYVAVSEFGYVYRLNDRSLGHDLREIRAFMGQLNDKSLPSLKETLNALHEKRQKEIAARPGPWLPGDWSPGLRSQAAGIVRGTAKVLAGTLEFVSNGIEALFSRPVTAEELAVGEAKRREERIAVEQARGPRRDRDRGRD